jgi:hypothetical protein
MSAMSPPGFGCGRLDGVGHKSHPSGLFFFEHDQDKPRIVPSSFFHLTIGKQRKFFCGKTARMRGVAFCNGFWIRRFEKYNENTRRYKIVLLGGVMLHFASMQHHWREKKHARQGKKR